MIPAARKPSHPVISGSEGVVAFSLVFVGLEGPEVF